MSTPEAPAPPPDRNESRADDGLARLMELTGGPAGWADGPAVRPDGPALWLGSHGGWREGLDPAAPEPARAG